MKILHTSDWHLGRTLYGRKRYVEFTLFLDWLYHTIQTEKIDILLICGDIFDTNTPSNKAQELYYQFLCKVSQSSCKHIVIIAGNHDSPSFLEAPKNLLQALNVHVIGMIDSDLEKEIIILEENNVAQAIICATPYLRDKDIRIAEAGENIDQKNIKLMNAIKTHYMDIAKLAEEKQKDLHKTTGKNIPIIAMGHLFAAGSTTLSDDGVRDLYVGSLVHIGADTFSENFDYVALGHLHIAQKVGHNDYIRYSGSPIPMGFGEANQNKKVFVLDIQISENACIEKKIEEISIPCFQSLVRISGTFQEISDKINELKEANSDAWLEIEFTGTELIGNLRESLEEITAATKMEIRRIRNAKMAEQTLNALHAGEDLNDLNTDEVFLRCLDTFHVPDEERDSLTQSYHEILQILQEKEENAE